VVCEARLCGKTPISLLGRTLCVGARVLDALRRVDCHARYWHEATQSVEEGIPTHECGGEVNDASDPHKLTRRPRPEAR
jgi:hypothetical protein